MHNVNLCNRCDHTFHGVEMASSDAYNNASLITMDYLCLYTSTTREHTEIPWCAPFMCPESVSKWRNFISCHFTERICSGTCHKRATQRNCYVIEKKNSFPGQLIFDVPSKDCGRISQQYKTIWISHKSFGDTLLEGESFGSVIEIFL